MQHLDEGVIHSWLDGALSADEAARVKSHVEECPQCAAAVAEARGFIAASSRILTALDNVPKGIVPIGARAKPRNWAAWRAAAAVLVVALGSFAVLRERMGTRSVAEVAASSATTATADALPGPASLDTVQSESSPTYGAPSAKVLANPTTPARVASPPVTSKSGNRETSIQDNAARTATSSQRPAVASDAGGEDRRNSANVESAVATPARIGAGAARAYGGRVSEPVTNRVAGVTLSAPVAAGAVSDSAGRPTPIRIVGTPRARGETHTLYEIAPGDTVLLAEVSATSLNSVVATGTGTTTTAQSADTSSAPRIMVRGTTTMSTVPDTQSKKTLSRLQAAAPAPAAPTSVETLGTTTLTWIDPASGNTMRLSGRHNPAELLEIKRKIEQLRAAEAAAKKKP